MKPVDVAPGCPTVTQSFGCTDYQYEWYWPSCPTQRYHDGVDLAGPNCAGTPMLACGDGTVKAVGQWPGCDGLGPGAILLALDDGVYAGYGHGYSAVVPGQRVSKGNIIGTVGSQGNSTGPHLHLLIGTNYGSVPLGNVDPLTYNFSSGGVFMALSDAEQVELLNNTRSLTAWIAGTGNGTFYNTQLLRTETPGGVGAWVAGTGNATYYNTEDIIQRLEAIEAKLGLSGTGAIERLPKRG